MRSHPHFKAYAALASVCFFWGTTYLAIRMALEGFPPLVLVSARFLLSGSLMLAGARLARAQLPRGRELLFNAINGIMILGVGNACLTFSELWIPSGLAALIITTSPFWLVGLEALVPGGDRLHLPAVFGMLVGCAGAALLVAPDALRAGSTGSVLKGFLILQLGCLCWSLGSVLQRRQRGVTHPLVSSGVQQLAAGLAAVLPAALMSGQGIDWKTRPVAALLYLVVFGSIVGYSCYVYALHHLPVPIVSIYNYVNPVVAVALGWLFYREPFGPRETVAMLIIFVGVTLVKRSTPASPSSELSHRTRRPRWIPS